MRNVKLLMIDRIVLVAFTVAGLSVAQQTAPDNSSGTVSPAPADTGKIGPKSPQWKGLTVKEKLSYDWRHLFDPENVVFAGIGAGFDQLRDRPGQWGEGWGPFAGRYGSHMGQYVIQRSIMAPVQAVDHEDTRYFRSARKTYKGRLADAFLH